MWLQLALNLHGVACYGRTVQAGLGWSELIRKVGPSECGHLASHGER